MGIRKDRRYYSGTSVTDQTACEQALPGIGGEVISLSPSLSLPPPLPPELAHWLLIKVFTVSYLNGFVLVM